MHCLKLRNEPFYFGVCGGSPFWHSPTTEVSCGHITTMLDYAHIHIFDACGHYKGRLLLILILHNVMHDITSTLPVDVVPSARFTQNGRPMSITGGRQE